MKLIAFSQSDPAGMNIGKVLIENFNFKNTGNFFDDLPIYERDNVKLISIKKSFREIDKLDDFNPEICVVASRHKSESGQPTLTCHATGNFGRAEMGGADSHLSTVNALYLREALLALKNNGADIQYDISLEVTHHGPTELPFPLIFVEVGSTDKQWNDLKACYAVAKTIDDITKKEPIKVPTAIGFGGPHYAPNFSEIVNNVALGHIASKYAVDYLNEYMVKQMIEKTVPTLDFAIFDWKGLKSEDRNRIIEILNKIGLQYKRTSELKY